jgi:flagellar biosynthesis GTPase FlhF
MELKRILANDAKTANDRAMSLYGRDVLIISSHSVGGQTELIVALDIDEQAPESVVTVARSDFPLAGPSVSFSSQMARVSAEAKAGPTAAGATAAPVPAKTADTPLAKPELVNIQPGAQFDREVMDQILDELKSLRREVSLNQKISGWHSNLDLAPEVENLLMSFTHAGMPTGLRTLLVDTVKDMRSEKEALEAVRHQLEQVVHRPSLALPKSGIHLVAGPSGTGKTLMVVRLASHAAAQVDAGRVAMVSYRDLRLGPNLVNGP